MTAQDRQRQRQPRLRAVRRQRGAVAVFVAAGLVALVASLLFVIDIGRLYYAQRQLQLDANMAALAGAQAGAGCLADSNGVPGNQDAIIAAVQQSLNDNTPGLGVTGGNSNSIAYLGIPAAPVFQTGDGFSAASLNAAEGTLVSAVEVGQTVLASDAITRTFEPRTIGDARIDSVRVTLAAAQPTSFLMGFMNGGASTKVLHASATAQRANIGSFSVGTGALALNTEQSILLNSVLGGLLGTSLNLGAVDYQSLVGTSVNLGQLSTKLNLAPINFDGTLGPLLTSNIRIVDLLGAMAQITGASALQTIANGAQGSLKLEQILGLGETVSSTVASLPINTVQLLFAAAADVGRNQPISIPLSVNLGSLSAINTYLTISQPPQIAMGPPGKGVDGYYTEAKSAQIILSLRGSAANLLGGGVTIGLDAQIAQAIAGLDTLACPSGDATITGVPNLVTLQAGSFNKAGLLAGIFGGKDSLDLTKGPIITAPLLGLPIVNVTSVASAASGPVNGGEVTFSPPYPSSPQRVVGGFKLSDLTASLSADFLSKLQLVGILPIGKTLASVVDLLTPLMSVLDNGVLTPLLSLLGVQIGYADITMLSVQQAPPVIVTNCLPGVAGANGCPQPNDQ